MGRGSSKIGAAGGSAGGGTAKPRSIRDIQIDALEKTWGGQSKAMKPTDIRPGYVIGGIQYTFTDDKEAPNKNTSKWSGEYDGIKMNMSADNTFKVTSVKVGSNKTTIVVDKVGGAGGTAKKTLNNDVYLRVYKR